MSSSVLASAPAQPKQRPNEKQASQDAQPQVEYEGLYLDADLMTLQSLAGNSAFIYKTRRDQAEAVMKMLEDAESGKYRGIDFARKQRLLKKFIRISEANEDSLPRLAFDLRGQFWEALRKSDDPTRRYQENWVNGSTELPFMDLNKSTRAQPDESKSKDGVTLHYNEKACDFDETTSIKQGQDAAFKARKQAIENVFGKLSGKDAERGSMGHLPDDAPIIIRFALSPNKEVQAKMVKILFDDNCPISEVHFGNTVHRRTNPVINPQTITTPPAASLTKKPRNPASEEVYEKAIENPSESDELIEKYHRISIDRLAKLAGVNPETWEEIHGEKVDPTAKQVLEEYYGLSMESLDKRASRGDKLAEKFLEIFEVDYGIERKGPASQKTLEAIPLKPTTKQSTNAQPILVANSETGSIAVTPVPQRNEPEVKKSATPKEEVAPNNEVSPKKKVATKPAVPSRKMASLGAGQSSQSETQKSIHSEFTHGNSVNVVVSEDYGTSSKRFRVNTTVSLNAGVGVGGEYGRMASISGGLSASGRITITFSRLMSEVEKEQFIASIGGRASGTSTELKLIELLASDNQGGAKEFVSKLRSSYLTGGGIGNRAEGEYVEIEMDADVGGSLGASGRGLSVNLGAGSGQGIRQRISVVNEKESITVTNIDRSNLSLGGAVGGAASIGVNKSTGTQADSSVEFLLDPSWQDSAEIRRQILAAQSPEDLRRITKIYTKKHENLIGRRAEYREDSSGITTTFSALIPFLEIGRQQSSGDGREIDAEGQFSNNYSSSNKLGAGIPVPGVGGFGESRTDSLNGRVTSNRGDGSSQSETAKFDLLKSMEGLGDQFSAHPMATALSVLQGNKDVVLQRRDTSGVIFSDPDLEHVSQLASDPAAWVKAWKTKKGYSHRADLDWEKTGQRIRDAKGQRDLIVQALRDWVKGDSGRNQDIESVLGSGAVAFQFFDENAGQREAYENFVARNPTEGARLLLDNGRKGDAIQDLQRKLEILQGLVKSVQLRGGQTNPRKLDEMQSRIYARMRDVRRELTALGEVDNRKESAVGKESAIEREEVGRQLREETARCITNWYRESAVFSQVQSMLDQGVVGGAKIGAALELLHSLDPLYEEWDKAVENLKRLHLRIGHPAERALEFAPNRKKWQLLYESKQLHRHGF